LLLKTIVTVIATALSGSYGIACAVDCAWLKDNFIDLLPTIISMKAIPDISKNLPIQLLLAGVGAGTLLGIVVQYLLYRRENRKHRHEEMEEFS